ncbi:MAG: hypothetical protein V2B17_04115 [Chloroflexota bacterium]
MAGLGALGGGGLLAGKSLAVLGAGLLAGALGGGALVGSGAVHFGAPQDGSASGGRGLELVPCPDQGPVIGTIPRNQQVLVTAKSADGGWLQLYWPAPGIERAWTRAGPLKLERDAASLPVARCEAPPTATPRPTVEPTPIPTPTPTPTPTPSPTPTPTPNAAPKVSGLKASRTTISFDQGTYCVTAPKSTTISVAATDADGIAGVTLYFRRPGSTTYAQKPMALSNGRYVATLDTTADKLSKAGELRYYVVARDANATPKSTRSPASGTLTLTVKVCVNTGPKITRYASDVPNLETNPLGTGKCQFGYPLGTGIQAEATDVDGVASITLYFRGPGMAATVSRAMDRDGDTWYGFINTRDDGITDTGTISWYVVAKDAKGATTKSGTNSIRVYRCDTPATFAIPAGVPPISPTSIQLSAATGAPYPVVTVIVGVTDGDGTPSVVMTWQLTDRAGTKVLLSGSAPMSRAGSLYSGAIETSRAWRDAIVGQKTVGRLWVSFVSTDPLGGETSYANSRVYNAYVYAQ